MSVSTYAALLNKLLNPTQEIKAIAAATSPAQSTQTCPLVSEWITAGRGPTVGVAPGAAAIPTNATAGALGQSNKAGTEQRAWLKRFDISYGQNTPGVGMFLLVDRLAHMSGLSGIVTTAQTVGFPALTRFTSGAGVWAAIEFYVAVGATGTTLTMSYTNTVPTAGQTSQPIAFGGTGLNNIRRILPISLASGDTGVTAVASVTVLATTGTAGNFGVNLFKTLAAWPAVSAIPYLMSGQPLPYFGMMPAIPDNACLQFLYIGGSGLGNTNVQVVDFFED